MRRDHYRHLRPGARALAIFGALGLAGLVTALAIPPYPGPSQLLAPEEATAEVPSTSPGVDRILSQTRSPNLRTWAATIRRRAREDPLNS